MKNLTLLLAACLSSLSMQAQDYFHPDGMFTSVGLGIGRTGYSGDLFTQAPTQYSSTYGNLFWADVEHRFHPAFALNLKGAFGRVHRTANTLTGNRGFSSPLTEFALSGYYHFDNDQLLNHKSAFSPFVGLGVGFILFDPHADLTDGAGNPYYYWEDGSIRDQAYDGTNEETANIVTRDYDFETAIADTGESFSTNAISIPLTLGLQFKLGHQLYARAQFSYAFTTSDYLDGYAGSEAKGNDRYYSAGVSLRYNFGASTINERACAEGGYDCSYMNALAASQEDTDGDGVPDFQDECADTPKGAAVTPTGCAVDTDNDGVPDHRDKEPNSATTRVDVDGVTISDDAVAPATAPTNVIKSETESEGGEQ